jgi:hypothetical protein
MIHRVILLKVSKKLIFYITAFWPKSNASLHFTLIGGSETTWTLLKHECQKWGKTPYQNMNFQETLRATPMYEAFSILKRDYVFFLVIIFIGWNFVDVLIFVDLMVNVFFHN